MERVTGIGGIFFKARDPKTLAAWYRDVLGVAVEEGNMATFRWRDGADAERPGSTVWSIFPADTKYFAPGTASFMVNFRVSDLERMLAQARAAGAAVDERTETSEFGRFGWVMDPEGNRIELWEPPPGW
jgi:predicted enzyme related to lactoylglutathione lyase